MYVLTTAMGEASPLLGSGISLWDPQGADSDLEGSWWLCGLVGALGTSFTLSLATVRVRGNKV